VRRSSSCGRYSRTRREDGARSWLGCAEELLGQAQYEFDAFVTVDRNLPFQQDLSRFSIAVIVLRSPSNRVTDLRGLIPQLLAALPVAKRGEVTWVGAEQRA
jgi:hypothetical protein